MEYWALAFGDLRLPLFTLTTPRLRPLARIGGDVPDRGRRDVDHPEDRLVQRGYRRISCLFW